MTAAVTSPEPRPCKICGAAAPLYGVTDFNKSCEEERGKKLPLSGIPVYYRRCQGCGFVFTDAFDGWQPEDFRARIYNDEYITVDPDYAGPRPRFNAERIGQIFPTNRDFDVLDYGGGDGSLARHLLAAGFRRAETYDPFTPAYDARPAGRFGLVTCFETLEHLPDPVGGMTSIAGFVGDPGMVLFSTLLQNPESEKQGVDWWYVGPRNGHVSIYSRAALTLLWSRLGFTVASFNLNLHVAFKQVPDFARHLFPKAASGDGA